MTKITIKVDDNEVRSVAGNLLMAVETLPQKVIKPIVEEGVEEARTYPPAPVGSRYRRTGTYGRSFKIESVGRGYRMVSDARQKGRSYTKYVGGLADGSSQAEIHKGRWQLIRTVAQGVISKIVQTAEEAFNRIATGGMGGL